MNLFRRLGKVDVRVGKILLLWFIAVVLTVIVFPSVLLDSFLESHIIWEIHEVN